MLEEFMDNTGQYIMGLHLMDVLKFTIPMPFQIQPKTKGVLGAFLRFSRLIFWLSSFGLGE